MAARKTESAMVQNKPMPVEVKKGKESPSPVMEKRDIPQAGSPENTVVIGGQLIEIKPTKLKYQRNRTAMFYKVLEAYPLCDILSWEVGTLGDDRDGDKAVFDWLIAVTDNEDLIRENYDALDTDIIERLLVIHRRVNKIDEKEKNLKNIMAKREEG